MHEFTKKGVKSLKLRLGNDLLFNKIFVIIGNHIIFFLFESMGKLMPNFRNIASWDNFFLELERNIEI